jgi:aspartate/methionine/tyrosine aminotransferase
MMRALRPFALEVFFSTWEFTAKYHMCASDTQSMTLAKLLSMAGEADRAAWENLHLGYTETSGRPSVRSAIASTYESISPAEVLCFAGAQEGIFAAMHALLGPDDHVIAILPNYQSSESIPLSICDTTGVSLNPGKNWDLDWNELRDAIRPNTRIISINFPNNPTGKIISRETLQSLVEIARRRGIYLFSDEVYRLLERRPEMTLPQVADIYERGLSLGVMSKAYGLAGLRVGWIACKDRDLLQRMERVKHYTSLCNSAPSELLAEIALKARDQILERNRALIAKNLLLLSDFFAQYPHLFQWYLPDGGCIGYPRYLGADGVEAFAKDLVDQTGALLLPASVYKSDLGSTPSDRFRVGFGRANMPEGLATMRNYLDKRASVASQGR